MSLFLAAEALMLDRALGPQSAVEGDPFPVWVFW